ncbi:MAG: DNA methyltransferase [bacterium]
MERNKVYLGDCIELLKQVEDGSVDLIIADPPYNIGKNFGPRSKVWNDIDEWNIWCKEWLDLCIAKLKPTGSIFVYGIHNYLCYLQVYLMQRRMIYRRQFIWYYENGFSGYTKLPAAFYEPLLWFSKSNEYIFHQIREPYKSQERLKNKITKKDGTVWTPNPEGRIAGDVWNFPVLAGKRFADEKVDHPTQKPLSISNRIVKHFSNEGDLILIPFAGSGSECVAAAMNNRDYIGFEINEKYLPIIEERLSQRK